MHHSSAPQGIELDRAYQYRFCSPTRCSLQTGRLPVHVNHVNADPAVHNPADRISGFAGIPRNMTGVAEHLKRAGYATHQSAPSRPSLPGGTRSSSDGASWLI